MKLNIVPARTGAAWVKLGIQTFFKQPLAMSGLFFMFMALLSVASLVPFVGSALALALLPAATLGLNAIPSGGSIGDGNAELKGYSVAANTAVDLTDMVGGLYQAGTVIKAYSGTGSALVLHGWGEEVL